MRSIFWMIGALVVLTGSAGCHHGGEPAGTGGNGVAVPAPVAEPASGVDPGLALQEKISLDVEGVPLTLVAAQLSRGRTVQIVYDDHVDKRVLETPITLRLEGVSLESVLYWTTTQAGLSYYYDETRVVLAQAGRIAPGREEQLKRFRMAMERRWRGTVEKELLERRVRLDVEDVAFSELAGEFRERYGINFVMSADLAAEQVTVKVDERPMVEALDVLGKAVGAKWTLEHEVVHFERVTP